MRRINLGALGALLATALAALLATLPTAPAGAIPQTAKFLGGYGSTCFWHYGPFGGPESEQPTYNLAYPNGHAIYFGAYFRRPAGSKLILHGQYPHSRNFNFVTYTTNSVILDGVYDEQINPDPGSINPFRAGENRNAANRSFSVEVLPTVNPNSALPRTATHFEFEEHRNYIYAANKTPIEETTTAGKKYVNELVMERVYLPDKGDGIDGGVPVPEAELVLSNGEKLTGQAACEAMDTESKTLTAEGGKTENGKFELVRFGEVPEFLPESVWYDMNHPAASPSPGCNVLVPINFGKNECPIWNGKNPVSSPTTELIQTPRTVEYPEEFPAKPTENWRVQYNRRYLLQLWTGDNAPGAEPTPKRGNDGGGFFPNPDNNYARQIFSRKFGKLVVLKGKMPTTPETSKSHLATWPDMHNYQLRFYDMCSLSAMTVSQVLSCKDDEETTYQDAERHYTLVYSRAEDKPRNAVRFCGISWLEWSKEGDANPGEPNPEFGYLTMRMLLPNPEFKNAVQYTTTPGTERAVMGEYLPSWKYEAEKATFEAGQGCAWANPGTPQLAAGSSSPNTGGFTLEWAPTHEAANVEGVTYTLQHKSSSGSWETVASGLSSPSYTFPAGSPESEGTWTYRVSASGEGAESEFSGASGAVKVDRSGPNAPSAAATRAPDYAGGGGWYKDSVQVAFSANGDPALPDGSEGVGVDPSTLSAARTLSASGEACGTVADLLGNLSAPGCVKVQVDNAPPLLEVSCPASATLGEAGVAATAVASDSESGLAVDPSGQIAIDTSTAGKRTVTVTARDNVGHETTRSCSTQVGYPTPGAPHLTAGASPSATGVFSLGWSGADPSLNPGITYTLQHKSASGEWQTVASGLSSLAYAFEAAGEGEGTWTYRVQGTDPVLGETTEWSAASGPVVVDKTPPAAPSATADRAPDYAGAGGWYKDSVKVSFTAGGDPALADGSPGSGVNPASLTAPVTFSTDGSHIASGTVADNAGNVSGAGTLTVQVDATPPTVHVACPATAILGQPGVTATTTASDGQSGLASDPSGTVPISTASVGNQTITRTATDNVGHQSTGSCATDVLYAFAWRPLGWPVGSTFRWNSNVTVKVKLTNNAGKGQAGATPTLEVAPVSEGKVGAYKPATSTNAENPGNQFSAQKTLGEYRYILNTKPLSRSTWSLRVAPGDGSTQTTQITLY